MNKDKVFLKAFKITNKEGTFTKEDFERFKEKFEIIRKVYFDEKVNHDYYESFRSITKEVKRAAHNAGLKAEIINLEYNYKVDKILLSTNELEEVNFNFYVLFKSAAKFKRADDLVITAFEGFEEPIKLKNIDNLFDTEGLSMCVVELIDDVRDETNPEYLYREKDVE